MKKQIEQTGVVPALALIMDVQNERFGTRAGSIIKRINAAFALPKHQLRGAGHVGQPSALVNLRLVNATTADQLPEMTGAASGIWLSKKGPIAGREVRP